jgi:hypothetical protein
MSTLGLIALVLAAVVVGLVVFRRRKLPAAAGRPKTVADLVRLRAESMPVPVATSGNRGSTGADAVQAAAVPDKALPVGARAVVPEPRATGRSTAGMGRTNAGTGPVAGKPEPSTPAVGVPLPMQRPPESAPEPELTVDDTPWGRAARMVTGGDGAGSWQAPASVEIVPLRLVPSQAPSGGDPADEQDDWAGWADWADVDAEEDARAVPAPSAPDLGFGASDRSISAGATTASDPTVRAPEAAGGEPPGSRAEVAAVEPAAEPAAADAAAAQPVAGGKPAEAVPNTERPRVAEPAEPAAAAAGPDAAAPLAPVPAVSIPTEPADRKRDSAMRTATTPGADESPAAAAPSRGRPSSVDRAAEQAAADLALLRTFGFADPGLRPDSAPVVSLVSPDGPASEPLVGGASQPVRYHAVRRGGAPAGHVAVTLLDDRGRAVAGDTAGPDGRGEVVAPASGSFVLVCTAPGHQPGAVAITVADAPAEAEVLLTRSGSLTGSVHGEDGPIEGARITLVQDGEIVDSVDTDHDGGYRIEDLGAGEYGLSVAAAGCEPVAILLEVPDETDLRHDVDLEPAGVQAGYDRTDDDAVIGQL